MLFLDLGAEAQRPTATTMVCVATAGLGASSGARLARERWPSSQFCARKTAATPKAMASMNMMTLPNRMGMSPLTRYARRPGDTPDGLGPGWAGWGYLGSIGPPGPGLRRGRAEDVF
jgi:hypothetical protein